MKASLICLHKLYELNLFISIFSVELVVELLEAFENTLHFRGRVDQICYSEMVSSWLLTKSTTWDGHNACLINHLHTIEEIRLFALLQRFFNEFLGEMYSWEPIHGSFYLGATDLLHVIESSLQ